MFAAILQLAFVLGAPDGGVAAPRDADRSPPDLARVYFRLGDLQRAVNTTRTCEKTHPKECKPLKVALVEYQVLVNHLATLSKKEAREFLSWDEKISPGDPGRLTKPAINRWVTGPLQEAGQANAAGNVSRARELVQSVLEVRPDNADAKAMLARLSPDAGTPKKQ